MSTFAFFMLQGELDCVGTQYHLLTNLPLHETFIPVNMVNTCTMASLKFYAFWGVFDFFKSTNFIIMSPKTCIYWAIHKKWHH